MANLSNISVDYEQKALIINGRVVKMIAANSPMKLIIVNTILIMLVIDNTGVFRDQESLGLHLKSKGFLRFFLRPCQGCQTSSLA